MITTSPVTEISFSQPSTQKVEYDTLSKDQIRQAAELSDSVAEPGEGDQTNFIGWSLMPRLFKVWDFDESGSIDREELLYGINEYCKLNNVVFTEEECMGLMDEVDDNKDGVLDKREFSFFLANFSVKIKKDLDDIVYFMLEILDAKRFNDIQERKKASMNYFYLVDMLHRTFVTPNPGDHVKVFSTSDSNNMVLEDFNTQRRTSRQGKREQYKKKMKSI